MTFKFDQTKVEYYKFLFQLRDSAICNMMESPFHLQKRFGLDKYAAVDIALEWMDNVVVIEQYLKEQGIDV